MTDERHPMHDIPTARRLWNASLERSLELYKEVRPLREIPSGDRTNAQKAEIERLNYEAGEEARWRDRIFGEVLRMMAHERQVSILDPDHRDDLLRRVCTLLDITNRYW